MKQIYLQFLCCQPSNGLKIKLTTDKSRLNYGDKVTLKTTLTNISNTPIVVEIGYSNGGIYFENGSACFLSFEPNNNAKKINYKYEGHWYCGNGACFYHVKLNPQEMTSYSAIGNLINYNSERYPPSYHNDNTIEEEKRPDIINTLLFDFGQGYLLPINNIPDDLEPSHYDPEGRLEPVLDVQKVFIQVILKCDKLDKEYNNDDKRELNFLGGNVQLGDENLLWFGESLSNFVPLVLDVSK